MSETSIHDLTEEIKPLRIGSNKSLSPVSNLPSKEGDEKSTTEELPGTPIVEESQKDSDHDVTENNESEEEIDTNHQKNTSIRTVDESTQTEPFSIGTSKYIDGLPNVDMRNSAPSPPSPSSSAYSDDQIDTLLKEVEEIKKNSPIKPTPQDTTATTTPVRPADPKTPSPVKQSPATLSPIPTRSNTPTEDLSKLRINKNNNRPTNTNIPNSVSQALFSKSLKVIKIHEKTAAPKFVGIKTPPAPEYTAKIEQLQMKDYELTAKIKKLRKEIDYLKDLIDSASITSNLEELRKLKYAIKRLESYLDVKNKEKYEVGISLTRALRRRVASGEIAEFWASS